VTCAASRLARFNISTSNLSGFTGLPSPGAAGGVVALIHFVGADNHSIKSDPIMLWIASIAIFTLAVLMVSKISFIAVKTLNFKTSHFLLQFVIACLAGLIWYNHKVGLFILAYGYALSGPLKSVISKPKIRFR
jgi:phosphatidylserine synthase